MPDTKPILKWVGGKRQLLPELLNYIPTEYDTYCEPFLGGGALLLKLQPPKAIIGDSNIELMNVYQVVRDEPERLIADLKTHENTPEYFYALRNKDRNERVWECLSPIKRASRILYLNKTCFNGLYRVNASGQFNAPFGNYKNPCICPAVEIRALSNYLNTANVKIVCGDYHKVVSTLPSNSFVYLDPPYDPISKTAAYTGYTQNGFTRADQILLREECDELNKRGIKFLLSNSATDFIKQQYNTYNVHVVKAKRTVSCKGNGRLAVNEVLVSNFVENYCPIVGQ